MDGWLLYCETALFTGIHGMFTRQSIIKKTLQVGKFTLISRLLGLTRDLLQARFLGASALSDAFFTAWKVPNSLRKIFAEGALSAAFVPTIVQKVRSEGRQAIGSMMFLGFLIFEGMTLLFTAVGIQYAHTLIAVIAPGFSPEQIASGAIFLRILMPFIFLISTSALLAGALQAVGHFIVPAIGPVLLNIMYIIGLIVCMTLNLPVTWLCWFIMVGGVVQLLAHVIAYLQLQFRFRAVAWDDLKQFLPILSKFVLCFLSMSVMEIGLFIDTSFGSLLSKGSVSLIYYANRWMGIPLGVLAIAFSTILLPHFSRVSSYAPKRLGFYLLESTKLVWWVMIPMTGIMMLLSERIFETIYLSSKFSMAQAHEASALLVIFLGGLFFFSINKILLNVYYALHHTLIPGLVAVFAVICNTVLNWFLIDLLGSAGLVLATVIAGIVQTVLLFFILRTFLGLSLYTGHMMSFMGRSLLQALLLSVPFLGLYYLAWYGMALLPSAFSYLLLHTLAFWAWAGPLAAAYMITLFVTKKWFGVRLLFLE